MVIELTDGRVRSTYVPTQKGGRSIDALAVSLSSVEMPQSRT